MGIYKFSHANSVEYPQELKFTDLKRKRKFWKNQKNLLQKFKTIISLSAQRMSSLGSTFFLESKRTFINPYFN